MIKTFYMPANRLYLRPLLFLLIFIGVGYFPAYTQEFPANIIGGVVTNSQGVVLPEVNISIPEIFRYTTTDQDGEFSLDAPAGFTIILSKPGYSPVNMTVEYGISSYNIEMMIETLDEKTAVAYGIRGKNELTHAISVISASNLDKSPVPNLSNAIVGKTTGLTVLKNSGDEPGYDNSTFYVRGIGTFSDVRGPLVLVDNIERDFSQLDPMEIESFSILKDAAATVQYGMRGANGAINVRTKRGLTGRPEINFRSQAGILTPTRLPEYLGAAEYVTFYNKALDNDGLPIPNSDRYNPDMYDGSQDPFVYPNVNWYDEFLKSSTHQQQHKLSLRGGTQSIRYFMFMGVTQQNGIYKYTDINPQYSTNAEYNRYNLRSNIDVDVTENLLVAIDLATRVENRHVPNTSAGQIFSTISRLPPNAMPIENRDGTLAGTSIYRSNPLGMISRTGYRDNYNRILFGNAEVTQKLDIILPGLAVTGMIGLDGANFYALGRSQQYAVYQEFSQNGEPNYAQYGENSDISLNIQKFDDGFYYMYTSIGGLTYFNTFGENSLGGDLKYMQSRYYPHGNDIAYSNQNIFGRVTYGIKNTYYAEVGFSYSGSENFQSGHRFGFFPAVSAAWVISNEAFMADNNALSYLKLRGSFGMAGNAQLGLERFPFEEKYFAGSGYIFGTGYTSTPGAYEGRLANPNLRWEESNNANLGLDIEIMNNLAMSFDLFNHRRTNIITTGTNTLPSIIGQLPPYENNGSVENRGFETMLKYSQQRGSWTYSLQGNISYAQNKVLNMDEVDGLYDYQYRSGKPVTAIWGLQSSGLFANQDEIDMSPQQTFDAVRPGDIRFNDLNGDGIIDQQDYTVIGNSIPSWNMGMLGYVRFKNIDLHFLLNGILGRTIMLTNNSVWILQDNNNVTALAYDAWEAGVNEENALYPRLTTMSNKNNYNQSDFWAYKGDFLRLTNLEIGYFFHQSLLRRVGINEIRLFVNAHNLLTMDYTSKYNLDPEVPNAGVTGYPVMRVFNTGVSIKF